MLNRLQMCPSDVKWPGERERERGRERGKGRVGGREGKDREHGREIKRLIAPKRHSDRGAPELYCPHYYVIITARG